MYMMCCSVLEDSVMQGLRITHISAGFDSQAVCTDENSPFVLKYKTPKFRLVSNFSVEIVD